MKGPLIVALIFLAMAIFTTLANNVTPTRQQAQELGMKEGYRFYYQAAPSR
jgi:hypothetical protein